MSNGAAGLHVSEWQAALSRSTARATTAGRSLDAFFSRHLESAGLGMHGFDFGRSELADEGVRPLFSRLVMEIAAYMRILEVIRALDIPVEGEGSIHVHQLQYADSEQMAQTLQSLIGGGGGSAASKRATKQGGVTGATGGAGGASFEGQIAVQAHKSTNSLLITSSLHDYVALRRVIQRLDVSPRQVFIEAVIMELSVQRSSSLGLSFHGGVPDAPEEGALSLFGFEASRSAGQSLCTGGIDC